MGTSSEDPQPGVQARLEHLHGDRRTWTSPARCDHGRTWSAVSRSEPWLWLTTTHSGRRPTTSTNSAYVRRSVQPPSRSNTSARPRCPSWQRSRSSTSSSPSRTSPLRRTTSTRGQRRPRPVRADQARLAGAGLGRHECLRRGEDRGHHRNRATRAQVTLLAAHPSSAPFAAVETSQRGAVFKPRSPQTNFIDPRT